MKKYISSIVALYGDESNIKKDVEMINDIIARQGDLLLIRLIAEHAGHCSIKYKMNEDERKRLIKTLVDDLTESLQERL